MGFQMESTELVLTFKLLKKGYLRDYFSDVWL